MYFDIYYFLLVVPALIIAAIAQYKVKSTYRKFSQVPNSRGITGAYAAQAILNFYGIRDVGIQMIGGTLSDNFNPKTKMISLSEGVYNGTSIAAVGIACHEAGHAAQHAEDYKPIRIRNSIIPVCNIGSTIGLPIAILGLFIYVELLIYIGLILYGAVFIFQLVTLPVEFDASHRALKVIDETDLLLDDEIGGARKVLGSAAMTYVAAMLVALMNLLRIAISFLGRTRRN
ncbi:MAG: zinc metallopeptidase [Clostridia bacterium]|nr:zinc metallopeptidase [Clostridia bacterium]